MWQMPSSKRTLFGKNPSPHNDGRRATARQTQTTRHRAAHHRPPPNGEAPKQATDKKRASVIKQTKTPRKPLAAARAAVIGGQQPTLP